MDIKYYYNTHVAILYNEKIMRTPALNKTGNSYLPIVHFVPSTFLNNWETHGKK